MEENTLNAYLKLVGSITELTYISNIVRNYRNKYKLQ